MELRAYRAEVGIASVLSEFYKTIHAHPVKRIPAMGYTGPDIEINEIGLVVDVKSRKRIPPWMFVPKAQVAYYGPELFYLISLKCLTEYNRPLFDYNAEGKISKEIAAWWNHMDNWRIHKQPTGLTALVLHKSNSRTNGVRSSKGSMTYLDAMLMIRYLDVEEFYERINNPVRRLSLARIEHTASFFRSGAPDEG